jgi:putative Mg2+ transporter-C (MgtC) family protein
MSVLQQITDSLTHNFADLGDVASATRVGLRLVLAAALGGALGYNRERVGKPAGLRTHMLVAIGSALFVLAPRESGADQQAVSRVVQGLVAGIGFLGAGSIIKFREGHNEVVEGLTTAASVWTTAAIGVTVAMGRGSTAVVATLLSLFILRVIPNNESRYRIQRNAPDAPKPPAPGPDAMPSQIYSDHFNQ